MRQSSVSHISLAHLRLVAQQQYRSTGRICRNFEPRQNLTPRYKAHQKHSQTPLPCGPKPSTTFQAIRRIL